MIERCGRVGKGKTSLPVRCARTRRWSPLWVAVVEAKRCSSSFTLSWGLFFGLVARIVRLGIGHPARVHLVFIEQDAPAVAVQIVELPASRGPEKDRDRGESEHQHPRNQAIDDFQDVPPSNSTARAETAQALNMARIRAELPITASELSGMDTAATRGVTTAAIASGTMIRL